jgi:ABC-type branched-subunit amino acid transport system ATPase component
MILKIEDISVAYNGNRVVKNLSINISKGAIFGIVGPNGAGKTTLLNAISNLIQTTDGKIVFNSLQINGLPTYEVVKRGISMATQHIQTLNEMSVIENVLIGFQETKADSFWSAFFMTNDAQMEERKRRAVAESLLQVVGLDAQIEDTAGGLSFGQKKRLDIARALAGNPKLLLMDEPTAGLDMGGIEDILKIMRGLKVQGTTILVVEHNMDAVRDICDEIVVMDFGEKIAQGEPEEVLRNPRVVEAYIGDGFRGVL